MCAVVHMEVVECLQQSIMHWHMLYTVNMEVSVGWQSGFPCPKGCDKSTSLIFPFFLSPFNSFSFHQVLF